MSKRISITVSDHDYEILKEYADLRGYLRVSDLVRRAVWRFCNQNPLPGKVLGEECPDERLYYYENTHYPGYVYFVTTQVDGKKYCKIGKSLDVDQRHKSLSDCLPLQMRIFKSIHVSNYDLAEKAFHSYFKHRKHRGEWFVLSDGDYTKIDSKGIELIKPPDIVRED